MFIWVSHLHPCLVSGHQNEARFVAQDLGLAPGAAEAHESGQNQYISYIFLQLKGIKASSYRQDVIGNHCI